MDSFAAALEAPPYAPARRPPAPAPAIALPADEAAGGAASFANAQVRAAACVQLAAECNRLTVRIRSVELALVKQRASAAALRRADAARAPPTWPKHAPLPAALVPARLLRSVPLPAAASAAAAADATLSRIEALVRESLALVSQGRENRAGKAEAATAIAAFARGARARATFRAARRASRDWRRLQARVPLQALARLARQLAEVDEGARILEVSRETGLVLATYQAWAARCVETRRQRLETLRLVTEVRCSFVCPSPPPVPLFTSHDAVPRNR